MAKAKQVEWRSAAPAAVVLVSGPEDHTAERAIRAIREKLRVKHSDLELHYLDAADYEGGAIFGLTAPSLFAAARLVVVSGVERCTDQLITDGIEYLRAPEPGATLVLRHNGTSVRGKKLLDALRDAEAVVEIANPEIKFENQRAAFVQAEFGAVKRAISTTAVRDLVNAFGENLGELAAACEQLLQDETNTITEEVVNTYFGGRIDASGFKVAEAAFAGNPANALALLRHALASGVQIPLLLGAIAAKMRAIAKLHANRSASAASLGMSPYAADQVRKLVSAWNEEGIANVIAEIALTDRATKGGERDPDYAVERLVTLICAKGELPGALN